MSQLKLLKRTVDHGKERKVMLLALRFQKAVDFICRARTLQLLAVQLSFFNLVDRLPTLNAELRAAKVTATHTTRDNISNATALLRERSRVHRVAEELLAELDHLQDADAHHGRFRVVAPAQAVDEAGRQRNDVLECAAERDAYDVRDDGDVEVRPVEEFLHVVVAERRIVGRHGMQQSRSFAGVGAFPRRHDQVDLAGARRAFGRAAGRRMARVHGRRVIRDGGLAPLFLRNLRRNVGARQRAAVDAKLLSDQLREQAHACLVDLNAFDA